MWDHPRACGVYSHAASHEASRGGSSPRVRGLPAGNRGATLASRIIPARAGFTKINPKPLDNHQDHPRACGVYFEGVVEHGGSGGSSPRVRGLHRSGVVKGVLKVDHPRACGVYGLEGLSETFTAGSSPRVRGLRSPAGHCSNRPGIIPARAGFTPFWPPAPPRGPDHPRACGVYIDQDAIDDYGAGSSPRVRGLRAAVPGVEDPGRIIPARAGFTRGRIS